MNLGRLQREISGEIQRVFKTIVMGWVGNAYMMK